MAGNNTQVSFTPAKFDQALKAHGVRVLLYKTLLCPNVKSIDGAEHEINCPYCGGNGFIDVDPIETKAVIQNQAAEKIHKAEGLWDSNQVSATFPLGVELQYFALVKLLDYTQIFFERIKRQPGAVDNLKYKATKINVLIDSNNKTYYIDRDFVLNENGSIAWKSSRGPATGTIYSAHYNAAIQYRATKAVHVARYMVDRKTDPANPAYVKGPENWMLNKEYLVDRKDWRGSALQPNLIRDHTED